ncbi:MAG: phosphoenolpyruvate carboxykinase (ATP), partial [Rhodospirillales bacterium]|nr:phosphoenolpyruvate carboxykinase (ATP) [Rhodospirillales bacterium]
MKNIGHRISSHGLDNHGLGNVGTAYWNLSAPQLYTQSLARSEGLLAQGGAMVTVTGQHTGRSPHDRFIVEEASAKDDIWWGDVNVAMSEDNFDRLLDKMQGHLQGRDVFVQDCYAGADEAYRLGVRVVTEQAWHNLFARNMFLQPDDKDLPGFKPQWTVLQAPSLEADNSTDGTTSGTFIVVHMGRRMVLIGGSGYAGEIKKSI